MFGIPLEAVVETVRLAREADPRRRGGRRLRLRGRTVPLIVLAEALSATARADESDGANTSWSISGGHARRPGGRPIGERLDVMLKPMEACSPARHGVAGTTLLGDGRVLLGAGPAGIAAMTVERTRGAVRSTRG